MIFNAGGGTPVKNKETLIRAAKVWTNADPTVAFPEQTVTLSADTGAFLYFVEYRMKCSNSGSCKNDAVIPQHSTVLGSNYFDEDKFEPVTRNVVISGASAVFSAGCIDGDQNDEYVVPVAIYAIYH